QTAVVLFGKAGRAISVAIMAAHKVPVLHAEPRSVLVVLLVVFLVVLGHGGRGKGCAEHSRGNNHAQGACEQCADGHGGLLAGDGCQSTSDPRKSCAQVVVRPIRLNACWASTDLQWWRAAAF